MNLYLCTYDVPNDEQSSGSNDTFVQAASPQDAFEIYVKDWRKDELERFTDDPFPEDEPVIDEIKEAFPGPMVEPGEMTHSSNYMRVFEIMLAPSHSQAGILAWVHGPLARHAAPNAPGVVQIRGYWLR